jgi:molybdopterin molybdotransferase
MLEPDAAIRRILESVAPLEMVQLALSDALGAVLAEDVCSPIRMPLWDNAGMDGYACRASDVRTASRQHPASLRVVDRVRAGASPSRAIAAGEAARIATGAPVPDGADTVIRIEDTDGGDERVLVFDARDVHRNVRRAGEDIETGAVALPRGATLGPAQIALLASVGAATIAVHRRPEVAIIATGDELVRVEDFDQVRAGRRIVASSAYGLAAAIRTAGATPVDLGIVPDEPNTLSAALERAATYDTIITTAGVSVGEADHLKDVVTALGGTIDFWRVRMRPGSPLAFGAIRSKPWLGLPGNPVSTLVTFELFARPLIRRLMGDPSPTRPRIRVAAGEDIQVAPGLTHYLRVRLESSGEPPWRAYLTGAQPSNVLTSMAKADALLVVPAGRSQIDAGVELDAIPLR